MGILKPLSDKKDYRLVELANGLKCLVVHEPLQTAMELDSQGGSDFSDCEDNQCKLAAASLCVAAGSFEDPKQFQGLAHFLEV